MSDNGTTDKNGAAVKQHNLGASMGASELRRQRLIKLKHLYIMQLVYIVKMVAVCGTTSDIYINRNQT